MMQSPAQGARPNVIIYTHSLLSGSMTFIRSHAEALKRHRAIYAGAHRVKGLDLPAERRVVVNEGGAFGDAREFLFRRYGFSPRFMRRLSAFEPQVVHAHFGTSGPGGLKIARHLGIPLIVTFHGRDATMTAEEVSSSRRGREFLLARDEMIARASGFIAVSEYIRDTLLRSGFPAGKVVTYRNGIDTGYFSPEAMTRERVVVFIGRFVEKKGCEYLLEALAHLKRRNIAARGVLIGDGPLRATLEARAAKLGIDVQFTGFLPLDEVKSWLNRAAIAAVPSVVAADGDSEGLPTVILEAQSMETAVVATRHSGIPEGVRENETAILVPERDSEALADALAEFLEDPARAREAGRRGRSFVLSNFEMAARAAALESLYEQSYRGGPERKARQ